MTAMLPLVQCHDLPIVLTVRAPVLVHATGMGRPGLDSPTQRDASGAIMLPGTLVHGRVRAALTELGDLSGVSETDRKAWFGKPEQARHGLAKQAVFGDLVCTTDPDARGIEDSEIVRIQMNAASGAVQRGMLQVVEAPFRVGRAVTFKGRVRVAGDAATVKRMRKAIELALRWNTQMGALRTLGFGRVISATVGEAAGISHGSSGPIDTAALNLLPSSTGGMVTVVLRFRQPFCVPERRLSNNLFESSATISGATIKGAIAAQWAARLGHATATIAAGFDPARPALSEAFTQVRVSDFVPVLRERPEDWPKDTLSRPVVLPLSLAVGPGVAFRDMLDCPGDTVFLTGDDSGDHYTAPKFAPDWKRSEAEIADRARGWHGPATDLRVRTSIDHDKRRVRNAELFGYEYVVPDEHLWVGQIGVNDFDEQQAARVLAELKTLVTDDGLWWVGKTKAAADVAWLEQQVLADHLPDQPVGDAESAWTLVLQTPALMLGPGLVESAGAEELATAYQTYWSDVSEKALYLEAHWSRHRLWGGPYVRHAYQGGRRYQPFLLTEPGTVFKVRAADGKDGEARQCLRRWRRQGLPLMDALATHYGLGSDRAAWWRGTSFVPENGFGTIHVNPVLPPDMPPAVVVDGVVSLAAREGAHE